MISLNELRFGIRSVERRDSTFARNLDKWYRSLLAAKRHYRILPVDLPVAEQAALYRADHGTPEYDSLIAATAKVHNLTLATRNTSDFENCGIPIVNPWEFDS